MKLRKLEMSRVHSDAQNHERLLGKSSKNYFCIPCGGAQWANLGHHMVKLAN